MGSRTKVKIHSFDFAGTQEISTDGKETCFVCGKVFTPRGVCIHMTISRGESFLADVDGYGMCASCVLSGPIIAAERARINASRLLEKAHREKDEDQAEFLETLAKGLYLIAPAFERRKSFSGIPLHKMAVKIAKAYQEFEGRPPNRGRKAA